MWTYNLKKSGELKKYGIKFTESINPYNNSSNQDLIVKIVITLQRITVLKVISDAVEMITWGVLRGVGDT